MATRKFQAVVTWEIDENISVSLAEERQIMYNDLARDSERLELTVDVEEVEVQ